MLCMAQIGDAAPASGNVYTIQELAGAFGDLGTLIPFLAGYITIVKMDPAGILVAFGLFKIVAGLIFKTPIPIQPMKAIGTVAITQAGVVTPGAIWASGLFSGLFWLSAGASGAVSWVARITCKPVIRGIVLGLGLTFILEGVRMMAEGPFLGLVGVVATFLLLSNPRIPAMLILLGLGIGAAVYQDPAILRDLASCSLCPRLPRIALPAITGGETLTGVLVLGLPQVALTLGNAVLATVEENNSLFPDRPTTVRVIALDHGIMNLTSALIGGVPMCHGAGGMAGHVRFGARTGGALVILGGIVLTLGLFFADSVGILLRLFPSALLGVILLFGGLELATGGLDSSLTKEDRYVFLLTAGLAMWNMGAGYLAGLALWYAYQWRWIRP
jgi:hypothetical protein